MNTNPRKRRQGWGAALVSRLSAQKRPARPRRTVLWLDSLEDRLAPAVAGNLYVVGTTLVYNGNTADNNVTVSGTDTTFLARGFGRHDQLVRPGFSRVVPACREGDP